MNDQRRLKAFCAEQFDDRFEAVMENFRKRPEQCRMMDIVADAIEDKESMVIEAGTGIGKTLAYLVPALLHSKYLGKRKRVLIATSTRLLQNQIWKKDLPAIKRALEITPSIAMLKGRQNYLCLERLANVGARFDESILSAVRRWSAESISGDLADAPGGEAQLRELTSTAESCLGRECQHYDDCFITKARKRAAAADIVVINHHLLSADMALREGGFEQLLGAVDTVIVDEAHNLPSSVDEYITDHISGERVNRLIKDIRACEAWGDSPHLQDAVKDLAESISEARKVMLTLPEQGGEEELEGSRFDDVGDALTKDLRAVSEQLSEMNARDELTDNCRQRASKLLQDAEAVMTRDASRVRWFARGKSDFRLHSTPLDIAALFSERITQYDANWIYVSATLSAAGNFDYFKSKLGLDCGDALLGSPYRYDEQAMLGVPKIVSPKEAGHTREFVKVCRKLFGELNGSALMLFTSRDALNEARELLQDYGDKPLLVQDNRESNAQLVARFKRESSILLGLRSFWEGIDMRGARLRLVAIDRLPFTPPDDPLSKARRQKFEDDGGNYFGQIAVPEAVIRLRQGVGRLIRDENDRGVVIIGDSRIDKMFYGKVFLKSLPPMPKCKKFEELLPYIN